MIQEYSSKEMTQIEFSPQLDPKERQQWQEKIEMANRNNILCHCRRCGWEWIDSTFEAVCQCGSSDVETISCWQFPDD